MLLFKDKINYKLPFGNGFAAHLDAPAYDHIGQIEHLTANFSVDEATPENGYIEVVPGSHKMDVEFSHGGAISQAWQDSHEWTQVPLHPGDILLFGSHLAHRSGPNRTNSSRSMIYATYHGKNDGENLRQEYYRHRRENFPPDSGKITYLVDLCNRVTDDECRACRGEGLLAGVQEVCFRSALHVGAASRTREDSRGSCSLEVWLHHVDLCNTVTNMQKCMPVPHLSSIRCNEFIEIIEGKMSTDVTFEAEIQTSPRTAKSFSRDSCFGLGTSGERRR